MEARSGSGLGQKEPELSLSQKVTLQTLREEGVNLFRNEESLSSFPKGGNPLSKQEAAKSSGRSSIWESESDLCGGGKETSLHLQRKNIDNSHRRT